MAEDKQPVKDDLHWKNRTLCSDENCIGTIGPDGRCRECGREYEGELPSTFEAYALEADDEEPTERDTDSDDMEDLVDEVDDGMADEEWENRILCSDESCIGVIGPDGRCKDCGKPPQN